MSSISEHAPGQRWVSDAEPELGLGIITRIEGRTLHLLFPASGEERLFARDTNPLIRVRFAVGDLVPSAEGWRLIVEQVEEDDGLVTYLGQNETGRKTLLPETRIDHSLRLNRPVERLLAGRYDPDNWFELRQECHQHQRRLLSSKLLGLGGARTSLIPHQLYIAHEVGRRLAPRVLLADEVGLGKTIEAGLIIHQQLLKGLAQRILILVPDSLQHQWLIEMHRRFNLAFSLFDEARCQSHYQISKDEAQLHEERDNPFASEQLILAGINLLSQSHQRLQQALAAGWDLLVVDEAHHLEWSEEAPSPNYQAVERLVSQTPGVLLLTATPEQLGEASHFARLRLLDPARFVNLASWQAEEASYAPLAQCISELLADQELSPASRTYLEANLDGALSPQFLEAILTPSDWGDTDENEAGAEAKSDSEPEAEISLRTQLAEQLLDRHGTGRIFFRNRRAAISGFPERKLHLSTLPLPEPWRGLQDNHAPEALLTPERLELDANQAWTDLDPRVEWLIELLKGLYPARVLLIAAQRQTIMELAAALRLRSGITPALFHEAMSLIERDRAAACFANPDGGCRLLLCSEIGSEGRNFQFAQHLVLFDLPLNPGLLEQRIGRLDRIGQSGKVQIHLPCLANSPQERLALWYHQGLNAFEQSSAAPQAVYEQLRPELLEALSGTAALEPLLAKARKLMTKTQAQLDSGRNPLLEYNSCRPSVAETLSGEVREANQARPLEAWLERLMDSFDMESELLTDKSFLIRMGVATPWGVFPGLGEDGLAVSCDRETALANEDLAFLTWEHPFINAGLEASTSGSRGNSACCALKHSGLPPGTMLLEVIFLLDSASGRNPYLPPTPLRLVLDEHGHSQGKVLPAERIKQLRQPLSQAKARQLIAATAPKLKTLLQGAEAAWRSQIPRLTQEAIKKADKKLGQEISRLKALKTHNPAIRNEEISGLEQLLATRLEDISQARLHPDALRLMVCL